MRLLIATFACLHVLPLLAYGINVTFSNTKPRADIHGKIMNAHDGTTRLWPKSRGGDGRYYMHAMEYGECQEPQRYGCDMTPDKCGFHTDHNISIWASDTLESGSWSYVGNAIDVSKRPAGIVYRPQMVYNPTTEEYVLWWNYNTDGHYAGYAVATAPTPAGPFTLRNKQVNITRLASGAGDYALFVDDDGTGYIAYGAGYYMSIEQLTPDFLYSTGKNASCDPKGDPLFPEYFVEAPAFFKRQDTYYLLFGHCCCYCMQGSGVMVHTAPHPLGPWTRQPGNMACRDPSQTAADNPTASVQYSDAVSGVPTPGQGCLYNNSNQVSVTRAQQNFVVSVETVSGNTQYLWTGDRWQQSPDGLKAHDPQTILPLDFDEHGNVLPMQWHDSFVVDVKPQT